MKTRTGTGQPLLEAVHFKTIPALDDFMDCEFSTGQDPAHRIERPSVEPTIELTSGDGGPLIVRIVEEYLAELDAGRQPDPQAYLDKYPALASQLEKCFAGLEFIHSAQGAATPRQLGDFRILREVGRGGMGVVYEAQQISLNRRIALKILRLGGIADQEAMQRFQREAETVAGLHHTNIVPIFAIGAEQDVHYFAMQFIEGASLAEQTSDRALPQVANWGLQAAEALHHAHQRGVVHRDVKPSNLILDAEGRIWLTDFGLAKRQEDVTLSIAGAILGTPRYMSPEQASAAEKPIDHRTDIYSLGATLYELATGRPLFEGTSAYDVISQILADEPPRPRSIAPDLPRDFETILLTCLHKDPSKRYQSAEALASDLRALLEGRPIAARRVPWWERTGRWIQKHRRTSTVAGLSAAAAILLVVGSYASWNAWQQSNTRSLTLVTDQANLRAEIFSSKSGAMLERMAVPLKQPTPQILHTVSLPKGEYQIELSAPGKLSESYRYDTDQGYAQPQFEVALPDRSLLDPIEGAESVEAIPSDQGTDLITIPIGREKGRRVIRRLNGLNGDVMWESGGDSDQSWESLSASRYEAEDFFLHTFELFPQLVRPLVDLDGDGHVDLVWPSRNSNSFASLLCLSGKTGVPLWWTSNPTDKSEGVASLTVGQPLVLRVDEDETPDFVAIFQSDSDLRLEAVSGRTGDSLWRLPFEDKWQPPDPNASPPPRLGPMAAQVNGATILVLAAWGRLIAVQPATGELLWSRSLARPPIDLQVRDLDDDGNDELVLLIDRQDTDRPLLSVFSLAEGRTLWQRVVDAPHPVWARKSQTADWPLIVDLDSDGQQEILLPRLSSREGNRSDWTGVEALGGPDGRLLWSRRLGRVWDARHDAVKLIAGPDLDEDGSMEVFAASWSRRLVVEQEFSAWSVISNIEERHHIYVDALSGADGRSLWWSRQNFDEIGSKRLEVGDLTWWQVGSDGWPLLIVPVYQESNGSSSVEGRLIQSVALLAVSAGTGSVEHVLRNGYQPQVRDFDGDGLRDLFYRTRFEGVYPTVHIVRGTPPAKWAQLTYYERLRLGRGLYRSVPLSPSQSDLDGDGVPDRFGISDLNVFNNLGHPLAAISGKTNDVLWRSPADAQVERNSDLLWADVVDLDGDGGREIVFAMRGKWWDRPVTFQERENEPEPPLCFHLAALSARDGSLKWHVPLSEELGWHGGVRTYGESRQDVTRDFADIDGDHLPDILAVSETRLYTQKQVVELRAYRGFDGHLLWKREVEPGQWDQGGRSGIPTPVAVDFEGDGQLELVVVEKGVVALDASDGHRLWENQPDMETHDFGVPAVVDHADGRQSLAILRGRELLQIGAGGKLEDRREIEGNSRYFELWSVDLNADGLRELLFRDGGDIHACRDGVAEVLWKASGDTIHSILPAQQPGAPPTVVAITDRLMGFPGKRLLYRNPSQRRDRKVTGLSGATGRPLWSAELSDLALHGEFSVDGSFSGSPTSLPYVELHHDPTSSRVEVIERRAVREGALISYSAIPTGADGRYQPESLPKNPLPLFRPDPRLMRPLPWNLLAESAAPPELPLHSGIPVVGSVWNLLAESAPPELAFATRNMATGLIVRACPAALLLLVLPALVIRWAWRKRTWLWRGFAAALAMLPLVAVMAAALGMLPPIAAMAALGLPVIAPGWVLIALLWQQKWRHLSWLTLGLLLCTTITSAVLLIWDLTSKEAPEFYSLEGWYFAVVPGWIALGAMLILWQIGKGVRAAWRAWRGRKTTLATA